MSSENDDAGDQADHTQTAAPASSPTSSRREIYTTLLALAISLLAWAMVTWETVAVLWERVQVRDIGGSVEQIVFITIVQLLLYGSFIYQLTRLGHQVRLLRHSPLTTAEREAIYTRNAPALTILVPSYKEEIAVVRRTLLSAALQDYPNRRVVLLIDDPPNPTKVEDQANLSAMRLLPEQLQRALDEVALPFERARKAFTRRLVAGPLCLEEEALRLADLNDEAAEWLENLADEYPAADHSDTLFRQVVLKQASQYQRRRAADLRSDGRCGQVTGVRIVREYTRLEALFRVEFASFERKHYVNLSHEPNKAMNLNSYIGLLGQSWREVRRSGGLYLEKADEHTGALNVPAADFLVTLDADSLLTPDYALVLINEMLRPGNERLAVAQTPYNAIPNPPGELERVAGATTDIQYLIHQGFTQFNATYWVGANALLRVTALQDIRGQVKERDFDVPVFVQDRTVIEDTESSIDLVARGWRLYNYPARLAYSATPADFGSLLIQRRRWANGGLLILPKLLGYLTSRPHRPGKLSEGYFRFHYLCSIAVVNVGLLIVLGHNFEDSMKSLWLPLSAVPYFFLYARDLRLSGYPLSDLVRVYALNLVLIPVNLSGVFKSLQQGVTGARIPFGRTPKVSGRTAAPALFILAEYSMLAWWVMSAGFSLMDERWTNAAFCLFNAILLNYGIQVFIGLRNSWTDLRLGFPPERAPAMGSPAQS